MKKKIFLTMAVVGALSLTSPVYAIGNATVSFDSDNTINVGDTFTVKMNVSNINDTYDGIVSMGGNLSFDNTKIEYVSSKGIDTPYLFQINEDYNYRIAGLDFTLDNGIKNNLTVYEFTFKALTEGNTNITFTNAKLTDSKDYINTTVISKQIKIISKSNTVTKVEEENTKNETIKSPSSTRLITSSNKLTTTNNKIIETTKVKKERISNEEKQVIKKLEKSISTIFTTMLKIFK